MSQVSLTSAEMVPRFDLKAWTQEQAGRLEKALSDWVAPPSQAPESAGLHQLKEAMRYAVLDGGKRLRPLLAVAACEAVGGVAHT